MHINYTYIAVASYTYSIALQIITISTHIHRPNCAVCLSQWTGEAGQNHIPRQNHLLLSIFAYEVRFSLYEVTHPAIDQYDWEAEALVGFSRVIP